MLKGIILIFAAVTASSLGQTFDDAVPVDQRNIDFNEYYVYTLSTLMTSGVPIKLGDDNMDILTGRTTLVVIHEHRGSYRSPLNVEIARAILERAVEDVNVLIVDWSVQAAYSYSNADASVPIVGRYLADYLSLLHEAGVVTPGTVHIVGFNLGAHIAGWAGRSLRDRNAPVARITGLDPSKCSNKLTARDANYVEVIHTDGGGLLGNGLGEQLGHADFFPNAGRSQPNCITHSCSHDRSWQLFAASLGWNTFLANCCNTMTQMRLNNCRSNTQQEMGNNRLVKLIGSCGTGIYRVNTKGSFPY